jgi:hypothetical protein
MHCGIWALDGGEKKQSDGTKNRDERDFVAELSGEYQSSSSQSGGLYTPKSDRFTIAVKWLAALRKQFFRD